MCGEFMSCKAFVSWQTVIHGLMSVGVYILQLLGE